MMRLVFLAALVGLMLIGWLFVAAVDATVPSLLALAGALR